MYKNKWLFLLFNLVLSILSYFVFAPDYTLLHYLNSLFYICFFYLILFLLIYTIKGGFFDGVTFGFRKFHSLFSKNEDYLDEWQEEPLPSEKLSELLYKTTQFQALALFIILLILLILYYLL